MKFAAVIALALLAFATLTSKAQAAECSLAAETRSIVAAAQAEHLPNVSVQTKLTKLSHKSLRQTLKMLAPHMTSVEAKRLFAKGSVLRGLRKHAPIQCSQNHDTALCLGSLILRAEIKANQCQ